MTAQDPWPFWMQSKCCSFHVLCDFHKWYVSLRLNEWVLYCVIRMSWKWSELGNALQLCCGKKIQAKLFFTNLLGFILLWKVKQDWTCVQYDFFQTKVLKRLTVLRSAEPQTEFRSCNYTVRPTAEPGRRIIHLYEKARGQPLKMNVPVKYLNYHNHNNT